MKIHKKLNQNQMIALEQAVYCNGYTTYIPNNEAIGFKLYTTKQYDRNSAQKLADDFIVNLGLYKNDIESEHSILSFLLAAGTNMLSHTNREDNDHLTKIALTKSLALKMGIEDVIKSRRSIRHYTGDRVSLAYLSTILRLAYGITQESETRLHNGATAMLAARSCASAGGIYPIDIYVAAINVNGLEKGIYQYNPSEDALYKHHDENSLNKLLNCFSTSEEQITLKRAGFICLLVGSAAKSMQKYGNLGLAFTLHEIGSISQNIHLAVTAIGLGSVDCASYYRNQAHQILCLDGLYQHLFHTVLIGTTQ